MPLHRSTDEPWYQGIEKSGGGTVKVENEDGGWMQIQRKEVASLIEENDNLRAENKKLRAESIEWSSKYHDLIMSVGSKWTGESRHDTAKRYIIEAETSNPDQVAASKLES